MMAILIKNNYIQTKKIKQKHLIFKCNIKHYPEGTIHVYNFKLCIVFIIFCFFNTSATKAITCYGGKVGRNVRVVTVGRKSRVVTSESVYVA